MFIKLDNTHYVAKINNEKVKNIDIFDTFEVENFIKDKFITFIKKEKLKGSLELDIYIDNNYGMIIDINKIDELYLDDEISIKIMFHLNNAFLYEIDYFIADSIKTNKNIYYYNNKFYLELIDNIKDIDYYKLLETSNIIYNEKGLDIIEYGIKVN